MRVKQLLQADSVVTVSAKDTWDQARQALSWSGIRHLVVMRGAALVGILTTADLLNFHGRGLTARDEQ